ncbi:MAG TPA: FG-GAP-like repeat-containing protein [Urbifossiella sp.]|jgi:uncharacterized delta-60 repeat protein|nr:FG-GAP-like repeat-containing protein [Urbifossiella sp.]
MHRNSPRLSVESLETREVPSATGALDPTFGTGGKVFQGGKPFEAVAVQSDGKPVAVATQGGDMIVIRYNTNGTLDNTFGTNGLEKIDFAGNEDAAFDVAIQSDGKIVVVGSTSATTTGDDFAIARLNTNGTLDNTFGTNGEVTIDFGGGGSKDDVAHAVAIATNGDIFIAGTATNAGNDNFGVAKLKADGTPATTFGNNGHEFLGEVGGPTSNNSQANGIAIQSDGKVVVVGTTDTNGGDFAVARVNPTDGGLDMSFNATGAKSINFGGMSDDQGLDVAVQPNGKIVVVGNTDVNAGELDAAIVRLNSDGTPDTTFDADGLKTLDLGTPGDSANRVLIQSGKIILVGNTDSDMVVAQLNQSDGSLDTAFGTNGQTAIGFGSSQGNGGALAPDGKIVVAGKSNSSSDGVVARLTGNPGGTGAPGGALAVGGAENGTAKVFAPGANGQFGTTPTATLQPFPGFTGEIRTATGDVNGDGFADTIVATGPGATLFAVISGKDNSTLLVNPTDPFGDPNFKGGLFVAAADLDGDGKAEIIVSPDQGGGPRVAIFSLVNGAPTQRASFFGIDDTSFRGGARVAAGDFNRDGTPDLVVGAGFLGGPRLALFDGRTLFGTPTRLVGDFFGFPGSDATTLRNGAFVAAGDVNGDGYADLILGGGPGGSPRTFILSGQQIASGNVGAAQADPIANFFVAGNTSDVGGVRVAALDADGDNKADVIVGTSNAARVYLGKNFMSAGEPATFEDLDPFAGAVLANGVFVG